MVRAAFFDLDKTVIAKSSLVAFGPEFHARGLLHRRTLIWGVLSQMMFVRYGADEDRLSRISESVLKVTKGWDHLEVKQLVAETINEVIEPLIYAPPRPRRRGLARQHVADRDRRAVRRATGDHRSHLVEGDHRRAREVHR
jgi:phosphoserine phosphatase